VRHFQTQNTVVQCGFAVIKLSVMHYSLKSNCIDKKPGELVENVLSNQNNENLVINNNN